MEEEVEVVEINPKRCYFIATYPDGRIVKGNALSQTAWRQIPDGLSNLRYELSDGSEIRIPGHSAYSVVVDEEDGVYYAINVSGLGEEDVRVYRINLRKIQGSSLKIGDVIMGYLTKPEELDSSWKHRE